MSTFLIGFIMDVVPVIIFAVATILVIFLCIHNVKHFKLSPILETATPYRREILTERVIKSIAAGSSDDYHTTYLIFIKVENYVLTIYGQDKELYELHPKNKEITIEKITYNIDGKDIVVYKFIDEIGIERKYIKGLHMFKNEIFKLMWLFLNVVALMVISLIVYLLNNVLSQLC